MGAFCFHMFLKNMLHRVSIQICPVYCKRNESLRKVFQIVVISLFHFKYCYLSANHKITLKCNTKRMAVAKFTE